ncbi:hypothetical protein D9758_005924 [Tetrapyrgos nigripes]|uniref:Uncharacterized protein n=1 Tax=Tetrapyrgos nigripes TaxID=182062 RepID=A0A8H5G2Y0_9AGAR|nr:hypothetical protein D9758_005924 [Tetrapyrgos nigripes]
MIVPINFNPTSSPKLPSTLAKISHDEVVLIELQGQLELENPSQRNGMLVGTLKIDEELKKPTLHIGPHLIEGKLANLSKPLAVLRRSQLSPTTSIIPPKIPVDEDSMDVDDRTEGDAAQSTLKYDIDEALLEEKEISWDAIAIVKRKIVFSKRPMPMVGKFS